MLISHYIGRLVTEITTEEFVKEVQEEVKKTTSPGANDPIKAKLKESTLHVFCNGDVANLIRRNKNVEGFRCDVVGESDFPKPTDENNKKKRKKKEEE